VEKYVTDGQITDGNIIRCMGIAFWVPNVTNTHSEYVILIMNSWMIKKHKFIIMPMTGARD